MDKSSKLNCNKLSNQHQESYNLLLKVGYEHCVKEMVSSISSNFIKKTSSRNEFVQAIGKFD